MKKILSILSPNWLKGVLIAAVAGAIAWFPYDYARKKDQNKLLKNEKAILEGKNADINKELSAKNNRIVRDSVMYAENIQIMQTNILRMRDSLRVLRAERAGIINNTLCRKVTKNFWGKETITDELINCK